MPKSLEVTVISLQTATERRELIKSQFESLPQAWSFFDAHTSLCHPDLHFDEQQILRTYGRPLSSAQLAVWSSHYSVIKQFIEESPSDYLLVFEDDVIFDTAFPLSKIVEFCSRESIHYIRLYGMYNSSAVKLSYFFDRSIIRYMSSPAGTQAYILSKEGARRFTDMSRKIDTTVDLAIDYFWRTGLPIYSVFPFPVIERFSPSSIPILPPTQLSALTRSKWNWNRIVNKSSKWLANVKLAGRDKRLRSNALEFQQVHSADLDTGR